MKWVGRIFYVIIVLYMILFIETSGGAKGLAMSNYINDHLYNNETITEEFEQMSAIHGIYVDKNVAHTINVETDTHEFILSFYRFGTLKNSTYAKENGTDKYDIILDGYLIQTEGLKSEGDTIASYELTFKYTTPGYADENFSTALGLSTKDNSSVIAPFGYSLISYYQHIISPVLTSKYDDNYSLENVDFSKIQDFTINGLIIKENERTIYYGQQGKPEIPGVNQNLIYDFEPIQITDELLSTDASIFGARTPFTAFPTKEVVETKSTDLIIQDIDLGKYFYSYIIIGAIYFMFIIVIPFFLWFRKPLKASIARKKEIKRRQAKLEESQTQKKTQYKTVQEAEIIEENRKKQDKQ